MEIVDLTVNFNFFNAYTYLNLKDQFIIFGAICFLRLRS